MKPDPEFKVVRSLFFSGLLWLSIYLSFGYWTWKDVDVSLQMMVFSLPIGIIIPFVMAIYEFRRQKKKAPDLSKFSPIHRWILPLFIVVLIILLIKGSIWFYIIAYAIPIYLLTAAILMALYEKRINRKGLRYKDIFSY